MIGLIIMSSLVRSPVFLWKIVFEKYILTVLPWSAIIYLYITTIIMEKTKLLFMGTPSWEVDYIQGGGLLQSIVTGNMGGLLCLINFWLAVPLIPC